ncbi:ankyrin repeat-containing domain protein [Trichoderma sp. SZMC 28015]
MAEILKQAMPIVAAKPKELNRDSDVGSSGVDFGREKKPVDKQFSAQNMADGNQYNSSNGTQKIINGKIHINDAIFIGETNFNGIGQEDKDKVLKKLQIWLLGDLLTDDRYNESVNIRFERTCSWIFDCTEVKKWLSESSPSLKLLWIYGPQGFGKTVLCAEMIRYIQKQRKENVAYYFFPSNLEVTKDPFMAMRSWIYHIIVYNQRAFDMVQKQWRLGMTASRDVIIPLFREIIKSVSKYTLVIDGLDQCASGGSSPSVADFLDELNDAVNKLRVRVLITSREKGYIDQALKDCNNFKILKYEVNEKDVSSDIQRLSEAIVEKLLPDETDARATTAKMMSDRSEGRFHWLKVYENLLSRGPDQLQRAIQGKSDDLRELYEQNIISIEDLSENEKDLTISLLRLAAMSLRPLTICEISEALRASIDVESTKNLEQWSHGYVKQTILERCNSLLMIRKTTQESPIGEWTVHPVKFASVNFAIKDLLLGKSYSQTTNQGDDDSMIKAEHTTLAKLCIRYMKDLKPGEIFASEDTQRSRPFINYAASFWHKHAEAGENQQAELIEMTEFFDEKSVSWTMWRNWFHSNSNGLPDAENQPVSLLCYIIEFDLVDLATEMTKGGGIRANLDSKTRNPLGVACSKGFKTVVENLLLRGADVGARDNQGRTALYHAALHGHLNLVELLIKNNADITIRDNKGVSPFLAASTNGHVDTMRLLIKEGADICQRDNESSSPIFKASSNGHINAVRLLIARGAHDQLSNCLSIPPIFTALKNGSFKLIKLLLDQENDLNAIDTIRKQTILYTACYEGKTDVVKLLIKRCVNLDLQDCSSQTPIFAASCKGHADIVKLLLEHGADHKKASDEGQTPLHIACSNGQFEVAKLLIEGGADIKTIDRRGNTALYVAASRGSFKIVQMLIEKGANVSTACLDGNTAIFIACLKGHTKVARLLLNNGADITVTNKQQETPLFAACENGHSNIVELLIKQNAEVNAFNIDYFAVENIAGLSPIHLASANGHDDVVGLLIENGSSAIAGKKSGVTPLTLAAANCHVNVVNILLEHGVDIDAQDSSEQTPLFISCSKGKTEMVKVLIQNHANISIPDKKGRTPLFEASRQGYVEIVKLLLQCGADMTPDEINRTPAYVACCNGHAEVLKLFIERKVDVNKRDQLGHTPLLAACRFDHSESVELLLKNGSNINTADIQGNSLLYWAAFHGHIAIVKRLIDNKAEIHGQNKKGETSVMIASTEGHAEIVKLLLEFKADINQPDNDGKTPLFTACYYGHREVAQILVNAGANITIGDNLGSTPIHAACSRGHIEIARLLLDCGIRPGINIDCSDNWGCTPLFAACYHGRIEIVRLLIDKGADGTIANKSGHTPLYAACKMRSIGAAQFLITKFPPQYHQKSTNWGWWKRQ